MLGNSDGEGELLGGVGADLAADEGDEAVCVALVDVLGRHNVVEPEHLVVLGDYDPAIARRASTSDEPLVLLNRLNEHI